MITEYTHPADQIVYFMQRVYDYEMTTMTGGNISVLDENGDIWISPGSIDKGSLKREDIICVKTNGEIEGKHKPSIELPFHRGIYQANPRIKSVVHAHSPNIVGFSVIQNLPDVSILRDTYVKLNDKIGKAKFALPGTEELKENIANEFRNGKIVVLMENHGAVAGGENLIEAFELFELLEKICLIQRNASLMGIKQFPIKKPAHYSNVVLPKAEKEFALDVRSPEESEARYQLVKFIQRSYRRYFISVQKDHSPLALAIRMPWSSRRKELIFLRFNRKTWSWLKGILGKRGKFPVKIINCTS